MGEGIDHLCLQPGLGWEEAVPTTADGLKELVALARRPVWAHRGEGGRLPQQTPCADGQGVAFIYLLVNAMALDVLWLGPAEYLNAARVDCT